MNDNSVCFSAEERDRISNLLINREGNGVRPMIYGTQCLVSIELT